MATITKKLSFENLLPYASMSKDSDKDGVVDGWEQVTSPNLTTTFFFDEADGAQGINVVSADGQGSSGVRCLDFIPVTAGAQYTLSAEMKGEGVLIPGPSGTGPQLQIKWFDAAQVEIGETTQDVQTVTPNEYIRTSITGEAPANAVYAKAYLIFRCHDSSANGTVWFRKAQLQEGADATDFEETDFFEIINPASDIDGGYAYGWEKTTAKKYDGLYAFKPADAGKSPAVAFRVKVPPNAENVEFRFWGDASEMMTGDRLTVWDGGRSIAYINPSGEGVTPWLPSRRGEIFLMFILSRATAGQGTFYMDALELRWEEVDSPSQSNPPSADRVYSIDFESDAYDSFFRVKEKANGYNYGFTRRYDQRNSGFYSLGVADNDIPVNYPEDGSPPAIPYGEKAACAISFRVPISAISPALRMHAFFDAYPGRDVGRILINSVEVWSTNQANGWEQLDFPLVPGMEYTVVVEYEKAAEPPTWGTDSIYIDDIFVYYDTPDKPYMFAATAPQTEIRVGSGGTFSVTEDFETAAIDSFFTVQNPSKLKSGGGPSQYPEAGWVRTNQIAYQGSYSFRAQREKTKNNEDAAVDFIFKVPHGVKNAKVEWWNFVELERSKNIPTGAKYNRLYEEYRIWVNYSLWKEFRYCSPNLTKSVQYVGPDGPSGNPSNDFACPWGRWWKEELSLTPGQTYTLTFELQRDSGDSSPIHGRDLCCVDNIVVSWEETPGEVVVIPPQPLIYFDGRDGYTHLFDRDGAEMAPLSFAEYRAHGLPGSIHQFDRIDPRPLNFLIRIDGTDAHDIRQKVRALTKLLANKPLALIVVHPDGDVRILNCRFAGLLGRESPQEHMGTWKKVVVSFRAFDPYWYGDRLIVDGADPNNQGENATEITVTNPGDTEAWPVLKLYGPAANPYVYIAKPGESTIAGFKLTGFTIPAGRHVVVDCRPGRKTIILDDGQNLYQYLDPAINQLFSIPPGQYNINLDADTTDNNTKIVAEFQPPYWGV